ncbi:MAG: hypothetical protein N4A71_06695 [Carboxylicivirga sp.]|jgi:chromosome segregation ATPase|nr:hypothetical protein [Carboxylicivirga sp.]
MRKKNKKKVERLVSQFAKELGTEESTFWYLILTDLNRVFSERIEPNQIKLGSIENNLVELKEKEEELRRTIETENKRLIRQEEEFNIKKKKELGNLEERRKTFDNNLKLLESDISSVDKEIAEIKNQISDKKILLEEIRCEKKEVLKENNQTEKSLKKVEYEKMINNFKDKGNSKSSILIMRVLIPLFTIIGIAIAIYLIELKK